MLAISDRHRTRATQDALSEADCAPHAGIVSQSFGQPREVDRLDRRHIDCDNDHNIARCRGERRLDAFERAAAGDGIYGVKVEPCGNGVPGAVTSNVGPGHA